jgi:hypothetical protein
MPILSSIIGKNEDLIPNIINLYGKEGMNIADVTYGNGNFWNKIDKSKYHIFGSDLKKDTKYGIIADFRKLPYSDRSMDMVVLDPHYMHGSPAPIRKDLDNTYKNNDRGDWGTNFVYSLYSEGMEEAWGVLKSKGILLVKCQDQVQSGKTCFDHIVIYDMAKLLGMLAEDLFVLTRNGTPMMRHSYQLHARKNHSFLWVFRKQ